MSNNKEHIVINPYTQKEYYRYHLSSKTEIHLALQKVQSGKKLAKEFTPFKRHEILLKLAELLKQNKETLALNITREVGKTISESRLEVDRAIQPTIISGEAARQLKGEYLPPLWFNASQKKSVLIERRPFGVILAITPFNFPLNLALHKLAPAFASGNSCLFKPNPQNFQTAKLLVDLCYQAGIPHDCLQLIVPRDEEMQQLICGPLIDVISFTGGLPTAKKILQSAGMKKFVFELGGVDPIVVMPDADLELASETVISNRFFTGGQRCNACKIAYVHQDVYTPFKNLLIQKMSSLHFDDPEKETTKLSVVISLKVSEAIQQQLELAKEQGAMVTQYCEIKDNKIPPILIENLHEDHPFKNEEIFAPILPLASFTSTEKLINQLNLSSFGLQAGLFTNDHKTIEKFNQELQTGGLIINDGPNLRYDYAPFGGIKNSGVGREGPSYAIEEYTYLHTLYH